MSRLIDFDPETGILTAEAAISLAQSSISPCRAVFPARHAGNQVRHPGRRHRQRHPRKNHEVAGSFGNHVPCFELSGRTAAGGLLATENPDWYAATIAGMG